MAEERKKYSDWYIPSDWAAILSFHLVIPVVGLTFAMLFPAIGWIKCRGEIAVVYGSGLALGCGGIILLFVARLPLYRQRRFLAFGPKELDRTHRRLYWLAYVFIGACVLMLTALLLVLK